MNVKQKVQSNYFFLNSPKEPLNILLSGVMIQFPLEKLWAGQCKATGCQVFHVARGICTAESRQEGSAQIALSTLSHLPTTLKLVAVGGIQEEQWSLNWELTWTFFFGKCHCHSKESC